MKDLKFRVWWKRGPFDLEDGKKPRMLYFSYDGYCDEYNHLRFALAKESREPDGGVYCNLAANEEEFSEPMQFTGLKDKNGKEIYEGDLLKRPGFLSIFEVKWQEESAAFLRQSMNWIYQSIDSGLEIIGNIHENPELLK